MEDVLELSVARFCTNETFYTNFWMYCLLHDYVVRNGDEFKCTLKKVKLEYSLNDECNKKVVEMLEKNGIEIVNKR